jgi:N-formylglutamate amidohydrolase
VRNNPYKGGYITKTWARPSEGIHVLQLEIKKKMYMHEGIDSEDRAFELASGFAETRALLRRAFTMFREESHALLSLS